jgi:hypothetical protein
MRSGPLWGRWRAVDSKGMAGRLRGMWGVIRVAGGVVENHNKT